MLRRTWLVLGLSLAPLLVSCAPSLSPSSSPSSPLYVPSKGDWETFARFLLEPLILGDARKVMGADLPGGFDRATALCLYGEAFQPPSAEERERLLQGAKRLREAGLGLKRVDGVGRGLLHRGILAVFARVSVRPGEEKDVALYIPLRPSYPRPWGEFCPQTEGGVPEVGGPEVFYPDLLSWYRLQWAR